MSVAPLPKISTLHFSYGRVTLGTVLPTIGELGRFHLTPAEKQEIKQREREEKMAFELVNKASLPVVQIGRVAPTSPSVVVTEAGAIVFNSFYTKMLHEKEADRVLLMRDSSSGDVVIYGVKKGGTLKNIPAEALFTLTYAMKANKEGKKEIDSTQSSLRGVQGWLRGVGYDFKASGSQRYEGKIAEKPMKDCLIFNLPKVAPPARPKQVRVKKDETKAAGKTNGAVANPVVPVADEELIMEG